jgi:chromosome segregation ATPase
MAEPNEVENASAAETAAEPPGAVTVNAEDAASLIPRTHHPEERIHHLEQALDESLLSLREMRSQLVDQHFMEAQLAATEEIANVQQQAILQLKQQLIQLQPPPLEQTSPVLLATDNGVGLSQTLLARAAVEPRSLTHQELAIAQAQLEDLETERVRQISIQTLLQHANRELEQEREQQQTRIANLERQTADLQEQILQQAQQATEYETAVQHWKDRYETDRRQIQRLSELLATPLPPATEEITEILIRLQDTPDVTVAPGSPELPSALDHNPSAKLDLPDFLMQRRRYKPRRSS